MSRAFRCDALDTPQAYISKKNSHTKLARGNLGLTDISGPGEARYQVKVCGDHVSNPGGPIGGSWDQIWSLGALRGPPGPPKGAFRAKTVPFRAPRAPEGARYQVKVCGEYESNPDGPIGGRWDQIWPPRALRGPGKDLLWPKRAFFASFWSFS